MSGTRPHYPWKEGDALFADELNAAIANSVANAGGPFLPLAGGTVTGGTTFNAGLTSTGLHSPGIHFLGLSGADGPANNWLYANISVSGGFTGGDPAADGASGVNKILVTDGAINLGAALYVQYVENGNTDPANQGERQATQSRMIVHGQVGTSGGIFVAQSSISYAIGSQGGLGGWTGADSPTNNHFAGHLFGGNDNAWLDTGASNYWLIIGREINTSIFGSASVFQRIGLLEITKPSTRQAQGDDAGLMFATEDAAGNPFGHKNAIQFGASTTRHTATDSLIKVVARTYPAVATPAYVTGLDFTQATFSGNALASPSFAVDGTGHVAAQALKLNGPVVATTAPGAYSGFNSGGSGIAQLTCNGTGGWQGGFAFSTSDNAGTVTDLLVMNLSGIHFQPWLPVSFAANASLGFFGTAPIAKPTGVAVTAAAIHAALVSYGLIAP